MHKYLTKKKKLGIIYKYVSVMPSKLTFDLAINLLSKMLRTDFVSNFSCHSHSDFGNVYLLVLSTATG